MSRNHIRLNRRRWRVFRRVILDRDGWACVKCQKKGRLEVDHIIPLQQGGNPFDIQNVATLCVACHINKTRLENRKGNHELRDRWKAFVLELV